MANVTDVKNTPVSAILTSTALGNSHPIAEFAEAGHKLNVDQRSSDGGKQIGRVQIALAAGVPNMMIATAKDPEALWSATIGSDVTPAYTGLYPAPTVYANTDSKPNFNNTAEDACGIASVPFPIIAEDDLVDLGHPVNYREYSGKKTGTVVLVYVGIVLTYAVATGALPESPWNLADSTVITPVGTAIVATSTEHADYKPTTLLNKSINSIDFPVFTVVELSDLDTLALYSEEETNLWRLHETTVVMEETGSYYIMFCIYDGVELNWFDLGGVRASFPVA